MWTCIWDKALPVSVILILLKTRHGPILGPIDLEENKAVLVIIVIVMTLAESLENWAGDICGQERLWSACTVGQAVLTLYGLTCHQLGEKIMMAEQRLGHRIHWSYMIWERFCSDWACMYNFITLGSCCSCFVLSTHFRESSVCVSRPLDIVLVSYKN